MQLKLASLLPGSRTSPAEERHPYQTLLTLAFRLLRYSTRLRYPTLMRLGRFLGRRLMQTDAEHSRIAAINIDTCFPLLTPQQNRELLQEHFEQVGMGLVEMGISWWYDDQRFDRLVVIKGLDNLKRALQKNRGIIFASAQFTTPDILVRCLSKIIKTTAVYHPHPNAFINKVILEHRGRQLNHVLMTEDIKTITDTLKHNHAVLLTHDMAAEHKQVTFVDFFGIQAATNTAISRFARMTEAVVIPVNVMRRPNDTGYDLVFETPLPDFPGNSVNEDTLRLNSVITRWIDTSPAQYGWSYPRFRQRPEGEPRFY